MPRFARLTEKWDIIWHTDSITHVLCTPYNITIFSIMLSSLTDLVNTSPIPVWWSLYHYPNIARRRRKFFRVLLCKHTVRCRSDSWWSLILNCSYYICAAGEIFWSIHAYYMAPQAKIFWGCDTNLWFWKVFMRLGWPTNSSIYLSRYRLDRTSWTCSDGPWSK